MKPRESFWAGNGFDAMVSVVNSNNNLGQVDGYFMKSRGRVAGFIRCSYFLGGAGIHESEILG